MMEYVEPVLVLAELFFKLGTRKSNSGPLRTAVSRLQNEFPHFKQELPDSISALLSDKQAVVAFEDIVAGIDSDSAAAAIVKRFAETSTIPNLAFEAAGQIVCRFATLLAEEYVAPGSAEWFALQRARGEHVSTRQEFHRRFDKMEQLITSSGPLVGRPALTEGLIAESTDGEMKEWHTRVDSTNRLLSSGYVDAAELQYRQIRKDALAQEITDKHLMYRLNLNIGICMIDLGNAKKSERPIGRALRLKPDDGLAEVMLARAALLCGRHGRALEIVNRVLAREPLHELAWQVRATIGLDVTDLSAIPTELQDRPLILLSLAKVQLDRGDADSAVVTTRLACNYVGLDVQSLVVATELLLYLCTPEFGTRMEREDEDVIDDLLATAFREMENVERSPWMSRALACRAGLRERTGNSEGAARDARRAYELDPTSEESIVSLAHALALTGDCDEALRVLDGIDSDDMDVTRLALRAHLLAGCRRDEEDVEGCIRAALSVADEAVPVRIWIGLAELATQEKMIDVGEVLVAKIRDGTSEHIVELFRARLWKAKGDDVRSLECYDRAFASVPQDQRRELGYEFASAAGVMGEHGRAIEIFEEVGLGDAPEIVLRSYCGALAVLDRWNVAAKVVESLEDDLDPLPNWVLDIASEVAARRDDYEKAVGCLSELVARGEGGERVELRLAWGLAMSGQEERAVSVAESLADRSDLSVGVRLEVVKMLSAAGAHDRAIQSAYIGMRESAGSGEFDAVYVGVFLRAPEGVRSKADPAAVGSNTWVRLTDANGSETCYWILGSGVNPKGFGEVAGDSPEAGHLAGKTVGESVVLRPSDVDPARYAVREIRTIWTQAFRETLARTSTQISLTPGPLQAIRIGDPESVQFLSAIIPMLRERRDAQAIPDGFYKEGKIPLSVFSVYNRSPFLDAYGYAMNLECGLLVEDGAKEPLEAGRRSVAAAKTVVCHISGLVTLQEIEMLDVVLQMFEKVIVPASLPVELRRDIEMIRDSMRGERGSIAMVEDRIVLSETSADVLQGRVDRMRTLLKWTNDAATVMIRPAHALDKKTEKIREFIGPSSLDSCMLASDEVPLYADDLALRTYARGLRGASGFSTYVLLEATMRRGVIDDVRFLDSFAKLIELNHRVLPVSSDYLYHGVVQDGYQLGGSVRAGLSRLLDMNVEWAATEFAAVVRELSVSPTGKGMVLAVVRYTLALLSERFRGRDDVVWTFRERVKDALRLLPQILDDVDREFRGYL